MADVLAMAGMLISCACGVGWLALAMEHHWRQACGARTRAAGTAASLRVLGTAALLASLLLALQADHPGMASLVWVMSLAAAALIVAFTLAWRPAWLCILLPWARMAGLHRREASGAPPHATARARGRGPGAI